MIQIIALAALAALAGVTINGCVRLIFASGKQVGIEIGIQLGREEILKENLHRAETKISEEKEFMQAVDNTLPSS